MIWILFPIVYLLCGLITAKVFLALRYDNPHEEIDWENAGWAAICWPCMALAGLIYFLCRYAFKPFLTPKAHRDQAKADMALSLKLKARIEQVQAEELAATNNLPFPRPDLQDQFALPEPEPEPEPTPNPLRRSPLCLTRAPHTGHYIYRQVGDNKNEVHYCPGDVPLRLSASGS